MYHCEVLAQRLLKVCPECSVQRQSMIQRCFTKIPVGTAVRFANALSAEEKQKRKEEGSLCTRCGGTGYQGRVGTYELMKVNRSIREAVKQDKSTQEIEAIAEENGMLTLKTYAVDLILKQLTTISELQKICNTDD